MRACRPSEPLLPVRGEAGHSKLLRAGQTLDLSRSWFLHLLDRRQSPGKLFAEKWYLQFLRATSLLQECGTWKVPRPNIGIAILRFADFSLNYCSMHHLRTYVSLFLIIHHHASSIIIHHHSSCIIHHYSSPFIHHHDSWCIIHCHFFVILTYFLFTKI